MDGSLIRGLENVPPSVRGGVLTIGNFDGVHLGHQRILNLGQDLARSAGAPLIAMTFELPPDLVIRPTDTPKRLTSLERKVELLLRAGADHVVVARTDKELLAMEPATFVESVIRAHFAPRHIVEGPNFFFGRGRSGTVETLRELGQQGGFEVHVVEPLTTTLVGAGESISSTLIRRLVAEGRVAEAAECLGRPYVLYGTVIPGRGRGRVLAFPTANIDPAEQVVPADGVYAGWAQIDDRRYSAAISIGNKPTFDDGDPTVVEAFLLDAGDGDFYGRHMALEVVHHLRAQTKFDGLEALQAQIEKDVERVRQLSQ